MIVAKAHAKGSALAAKIVASLAWTSGGLLNTRI